MRHGDGASASAASSGAAEIAMALAENRRLFVAIGVFSTYVNFLMLTGPMFMLQVYDRELTSRSEATLVALIVITAFLFLMMGLLVQSLSEPSTPEGSAASLPSRPFQLLPAGTTVDGWECRPLKERAFARCTEKRGQTGRLFHPYIDSWMRKPRHWLTRARSGCRILI